MMDGGGGDQLYLLTYYKVYRYRETDNGMTVVTPNRTQKKR